MIGLFYYPMSLPSNSLLWMLLPLCLGAAIVYKTIRASDLKRLWLDIVMLFGYIVVGLVLMGAGLVAIVKYWP